MTADYVPSFLNDEVLPAPRPTPDDWIIAIDGQFFIGDDDNREEISNGNITSFMRLETFPDSKLSIEDDGSWKVDPPAPEGAEQVMIDYDPDTMDSSVESLVQNYQLDAGDYQLNFYTWHDEVWSFDAAAGKFLRGAA